MGDVERIAFERIRKLTFREFWHDAVMYLGIKPEIAEHVWRLAHGEKNNG